MAVDADPTDEVDEPATESPDGDADAVNESDNDDTDGNGADSINSRSEVRLAIVVGLLIAAALTGVAGWLGYRAYQSHQAQQQRNLFIQAARQGALNLTTINYTEADADVQRILESATGTFYDDFQKRAQPFIEVVKQAQSKSDGAIVEAGLESEDGDQARVLVAVNVNTSIAGVAEPKPRAWRMRISVQKVGEDAKVSNVEFVP